MGLAGVCVCVCVPAGSLSGFCCFHMQPQYCHPFIRFICSSRYPPSSAGQPRKCLLNYRGRILRKT